MESKKILTAMSLTLCCVATSFANGKVDDGKYAVSGPDGKVKFEIKENQGEINYSLTYDGAVFIENSRLGLNTDMGDYTKGMKLLSASKPKIVTDSYSLPNGKKSKFEYKANEVVYSIGNSQGKKVYDIVVRVDDSNAAFKYVMHASGSQRSCLVKEEATSYTLPQGSTAFICPQMAPQSGFARTAPSYETFYELDATPGKNGHGFGYTFPALFRISDKGWVMLCETGVGSNYCASHLKGGDGYTYSVAYPDEKDFGGIGSASPGIQLPGETPWRTITVGASLRPIAETTIMTDLVKPQYATSEAYKYGRATWSWIIRMDASCNYEEQKEYIDFAAAMNYEYVLIDALWDTQIGYDGIEKLAKYAAEKGVGLFLWYNSNGYWNDAPQGPRGKMHTVIARRNEMRWLKKTGIKGLKIDFIGSDKQQAMQMYEDILADANEYGLMIIYHGCTLPRGWERMYPNFVSGEAVRASENLSFGQHDCDIEAECGTIHPILRNSVANMDFGGSALNKHYSKDNVHGKERKTSDVYALATAVLFQTPVQNFALAPNNLTDAPKWAIDFMKSVPTTWDDLCFIDGYPGKYCVMARLHNGKWYIAAINAQKEPLKMKINLDMLNAGQSLTVYSDDPKLQGSVKTMKLAKNKLFSINVPCNGGELIVAE